MTPAHGTPARARQHYREKTKICEPCRKAANLEKAERYQKRKRGRPDYSDKPRVDWDAAIQRVRAMLDAVSP